MAILIYSNGILEEYKSKILVFSERDFFEIFKNVEKLKSLGLDVPQVTELAYELRKMGIEISDDVLTVDECFDEIIRILGETKR